MAPAKVVYLRQDNGAAPKPHFSGSFSFRTFRFEVKLVDPAFQYQLVVNLTVSLQLIASGLLFLRPVQKRSRYALRMFLALCCCALVYTAAVWIRMSSATLTTRFIMRLMQFSMPLIISFFSYECEHSMRWRVWCAGVAAMEAGSAVYSFFLTLLRVDERTSISVFPEPYRWANWTVYVLVRLAVYLLLYYFFGRKAPETQPRSGRAATVALATGCLIFLTVPDCVSNEYKNLSYPLYLTNKLYLLALSAFIMAICTSIEFHSRYEADRKIMDQVLHEERKQYQRMKENMDVINMRCHDLRHHLDDFSGKLTDREVESLRGAMDFYDSNIKTGCEVLDVVLHSTQLTAREDGIEITCLADGSCLNFIRTRHLYSLFSNALGNAIEAVKKLSDPAMRVIGISVERRAGNAVIEVTNYYDGATVQEDKTTKKDKHRHGFGTMSMRYIAESYGGKVQVHTGDGLYMLTITIPIPSDYGSSQAS